jgi:hypothetical protein
MLHRDLGLKTFEVAKDRGDSSHASIALKAKETIFAHHVSVDHDLVPRLCVADIVDRDIVVLAPEERHLSEGCSLPKHVERRGLSLALSNNPVLDADVLTRIWIRPSSDVARGKDIRRACLEILVDGYATVEPESCFFCEF